VIGDERYLKDVWQEDCKEEGVRKDTEKPGKKVFRLFERKNKKKVESSLQHLYTNW